MKLDFSNFADPELSEDLVAYLAENEAPDRALHFGRLWAYYRNELTPLGTGLTDAERNMDWVACARPYCQAQEFGLPARITGRSHLGYGGVGVPEPALTRKEVVIENDIGWRIDTAVHFLAGKTVSIESLARRPESASRIEAVLKAVWDASGGLALLQELALLGGVYGFVDLVIRPLPEVGRPGESQSGDDSAGAAALRAARSVFLEPIEAPRVIPILDENDYRRVRYWIQAFHKQTNHLTGGGLLGRLLGKGPRRIDEIEVVEVLGPAWWQRYEDGHLAAEGPNPIGRVPVVHIQNLSNPMHYEGAGEVEPLVPLQDELNTRLPRDVPELQDVPGQGH
jgi:hypothetical protein